jgi:hypothetical protein
MTRRRQATVTVPESLLLKLYFIGGSSGESWQGQIIAVRDSVALVQLYSWLDGRPTEMRAVKVADLMDGSWRLFRKRQEWRLAGDGLLRQPSESAK